MSKRNIDINDFRKKKYCVKGIKAWFEQNDLDFNTFLNNGIDAELLEKTNDFRALQIVREKYGQKETNN